MLAERLGGYIPQPVKVEFQKSVATHGVRKMALDPDTPVEAIIGGLVCGLEEYAFDWFKLMVETAGNPVANRVLRLILRDEVRHCAFGWLYLEHRAPQLTAEQRERVEQAAANATEHVELNGYRVPWLAPDTPAARAEMDADRICWEAGLGASVEEIEKPVFVASVARVRERLGALGFRLPMFHHPRIGQV